MKPLIQDDVEIKFASHTEQDVAFRLGSAEECCMWCKMQM